MRITRIVLSIFFISLFCCETVDKTEMHSGIIPKPVSQELKTGEFILNRDTQLLFPDAFEVPAQYLKQFIQPSIKLKEIEGRNVILFEKSDSITNPEAYRLDISPTAITIGASSPQGAFYGAQTLRQLLPSILEKTKPLRRIRIPAQTITDSPQFPYRGMHLDVGRHMFSVEFIKKYIDMLAMLKLNTFHWHLTEDQGWRVEIKKYPKLNTIAAYRKETLVGHYSDQPHQFDGKRYGGYYTQEQIKDVVAYAQKRFITVIPEIEMPGHSQAAVAAYPELGCTNEPVEVATKWGVFEHIYCTKENTFTFLEDVLDEVLELFPSKYIHIGGDEAPKTNWKSCSDCQKRMKDEGLTDEHELQSYFINRMETYLNSKGRQIIGWDEILEGGLAPNATVMSWRGVAGGIEAAKAKHNVIMTPTSNLYFDYYQSDNPNEPLAIGGFLPLKKVYDYNPIPDELSEEESQYILGAQGNIWTEYMPSEKLVEYMAFPRMTALSEVLWTATEKKDYPDFVKRLEHFNKRLDVLDINYANHLYEVEGALKQTEAGLVYSLNTLTEDKTIHYMTNGESPDIFSYIYEAPIKIDSSMTIKAAVFHDADLLGRVFSETINLHKAVGKNISLSVEPHKAYNAGGKQALINGISGSDARFGDKEWLGFWGDDVEIIIDLGEFIDINSIEMRFYNAPGQWIYAPNTVGFSFDNAIVENYVGVNNSDSSFGKCHIYTNHNKIIRYITLKIPNYGIIPEGLQGAGNKAWTFIDEIIVN